MDEQYQELLRCIESLDARERIQELGGDVLDRIKNRFVLGNPRVWWLSFRFPPKEHHYDDDYQYKRISCFLNNEDFCYFMGLQQFGVTPFEIRTLKKPHTEKWRAQRFYIAEIVRHRGTIGAWRNRGYLRVLLMFLSTSLQSSGLQDFLKRLFVYYQSYQQHVHYGSVALCAFGTSVRLSAFTSVFSPSLCAFYM